MILPLLSCRRDDVVVVGIRIDCIANENRDIRKTPTVLITDHEYDLASSDYDDDDDSKT